MLKSFICVDMFGIFFNLVLFYESFGFSSVSYYFSIIVLFIFKIYLFYLFLFLAALGLRCCVRAFSSCGELGLLFVAAHELLIAVASLIVEHGL